MTADLDASSALASALPHELPGRIVAAASACAGAPAGAYVIDVDGSRLHLLAGDGFPGEIAIPRAIGPELPLEALPELRAAVREAIPGAACAPMVLGHRALGALVARAPEPDGLAALAAEAALVLELGRGYTDVVDGSRRRRRTDPSAEIQQNLLPPRLARADGADIAAAVLPGYDVGGDFFDHAQNPGGLWLTVADAVGKGGEAAALSSLAVGALRAARRAGASIEDAAWAMDAAIRSVGRPLSFVTAVLARWEPGSGRLRWVNCGHPSPLLVAGSRVEPLDEARNPPLGLLRRGESLRAAERPLRAGSRLVVFSDGVSEREREDGRRLGVGRVVELAGAAGNESAARICRAIQDAVVAASPSPLRDDATILVLGLDPGHDGEPPRPG